MLLINKKKSSALGSEITPNKVYQERRRFIKQSAWLAAAGAGLVLSGCSQEGNVDSEPIDKKADRSKQGDKEQLQAKKGKYGAAASLTQSQTAGFSVKLIPAGGFGLQSDKQQARA
ncbi:twin-arginine translocation signal domain-containing protein [uncultured Endozoicomonas sp.]|uniref:twin-arginine translocation signal domain-containing protein n=1 Tax=uncultured Endozoicomonas sp. TaxID=432652 RepID=UPI002629FCF1|nr:twin-arginine translocation signal domain-containing protein [uncultured Endozoicomonas sp.]